ncbi:thioredoxin family protein [Phycicoccus sp. KQZ13P-1]|uniref:thioredoxin family protein n=1 Tax=Phycicoccus mangrovi TaxID=2840470 RepID=UPI001C001DCA|nr:thioredoxin family protein [Phycicoccus mangrovi]MBT9255306.1 thioredoxin family protein [Phycicoccus mangrovi]
MVSLLMFTACGTTTASQAPGGATPPAVTASPSSPASRSTPMPPSGAVTPVGAYLSKAEYTEQAASRAGTKVVYFFHATWCPTCWATEKAIARGGIPDGLTVVKVDFDSEGDLRKKYGVTTQHTFVQVDASGAEVAKWTGSKDGAEILAKTV